MARNEELREASTRIEQALQEVAAIADPQLRGRVEQLLRLILELYGEGLARTVEILADDPAGNPLLARLTEDDLVASLLLVHGLHPESVAARVERALDEVRPYLGSHGGDVELLGVEDGVVRLQLLGSCDGCPSSSVTLKLAVEGAIEAAAPEVVALEVLDAPGATGSHNGLIPLESLMRPPAGTGADPPAAAPSQGPQWEQVPATELPQGPGLTRTSRVGIDIVLARTTSDLYAYHDRCAACGGGIAAGELHGDVLTCPACGAEYDLCAAGRPLSGAAGHLEPLPLLRREHGVEIAVPQAVV